MCVFTFLCGRPQKLSGGALPGCHDAFVVSQASINLVWSICLSCVLLNEAILLYNKIYSKHLCVLYIYIIDERMQML